jgi:rubredoxin
MAVWRRFALPGYSGTIEFYYTTGLRPRFMEYSTWMCLVCGFVYDEARGMPEEGIPPGTRWEDLPLNWTCPECGARKEDFEMVKL